MNYAQPASVDEALCLLDSDSWTILSGGTDVYPALGDRMLAGNILDVSRIQSLRGIHRDDRFWHIGARSSWTDLMRSDVPDGFVALKQAAREIGSIQIQNRATLVGNICNASPAADGVPPLLCLDAEVDIASGHGTRHVPLADFIIGNRQTLLGPREMVTGLRIPIDSSTGHSHFLKLGARSHLVISIAMVACRLSVSGGMVDNASISVGSCSVVAQRLGALERDLRGRVADETILATVGPQHLDPLSPIDDIRSSANYRRQAALELVRRALAACLPRS